MSTCNNIRDASSIADPHHHQIERGEGLNCELPDRERGGAELPDRERGGAESAGGLWVYPTGLIQDMKIIS